MRTFASALAALLLASASATTSTVDAAPSFPLYFTINYCWGDSVDPQNLDTQCTGPEWHFRLNQGGTGSSCEGGLEVDLDYNYNGNSKIVDFDFGFNLHYMGKHLGRGQMGGVITDDRGTNDPLNDYDGVWSGRLGSEAAWTAEGCL